MLPYLHSSTTFAHSRKLTHFILILSTYMRGRACIRKMGESSQGPPTISNKLTTLLLHDFLAVHLMENTTHVALMFCHILCLLLEPKDTYPYSFFFQLIYEIVSPLNEPRLIFKTTITSSSGICVPLLAILKSCYIFFSSEINQEMSQRCIIHLILNTKLICDI